MSKQPRRSWCGNFNPRSSCEERLKRMTNEQLVNISIHAPHARSDLVEGPVPLVVLGISIHAPHARSDVKEKHLAKLGEIISIHAPHARSDPCWRGRHNGCQYFNPRSSCEERRQ